MNGLLNVLDLAVEYKIEKSFGQVQLLYLDHILLKQIRNNIVSWIQTRSTVSVNWLEKDLSNGTKNTMDWISVVFAIGYYFMES